MAHWKKHPFFTALGAVTEFHVLQWLCGWRQLWSNWDSGALPQRWRMQLYPDWLQPGSRTAADGFAGTSFKEGKIMCDPLWEFTVAAPPNIARARYCRQDRATPVHVCSYWFVCCMLLYSRITSPWGRESTRGSDEDTMCRQQGVFATPSQHSWDTSFLPKFQPDLGESKLAKGSSESDIWT